MIIYRGIKLADSVKLYKKDGCYNKTVKNGLDALVDRLIENCHEVVSEYIGDKTKILVNFNCGHPPHNIIPTNYKKGSGCPKCSGLCPEQAKEDFISLLELNEHQLLSEYINSYTKVLIDFKCGHDPYEIDPSSYKYGSGCHKCSGNCQEKAKENLISLVKFNGHEWVDGEYVNAHVKVLIDFKCNHRPHWIAPHDYKKGNRCPKCSKRCPEQAKEEFFKFVEVNNHTLLSEYVSSSTKIKIDYKCGHEPHWALPTNYKNGQGCPVCKESKGEKRIRKWLIENNYEFEAQKEYDGLLGLGGGLLSYDFYIPNQNLLIEYQGQFHDGSSGEYTQEKLEYQQEHDRRKKVYAEKNNITLLEIWYWDFDNVDSILNKLIHNEYVEVDKNLLVI
jgi:ferredoxin